MLHSEGMARRKDLRPINETRRPEGTPTSETARRLLSRRGGLARAKQQSADRYKMLAETREKSILARSLKAAVRRDRHDCKAFAKRCVPESSRLMASCSGARTRIEPRTHRTWRQADGGFDPPQKSKLGTYSAPEADWSENAERPRRDLNPCYRRERPVS